MGVMAVMAQTGGVTLSYPARNHECLKQQGRMGVMAVMVRTGGVTVCYPARHHECLKQQWQNGRNGRNGHSLSSPTFLQTE